MRFDVILSQYLSQHKKLNLPGIGTFETDSAAVAWDENGKQKQPGSSIIFRNTPVAKADDDLIAFITEQTGKMKPLAISDLESYLTLGKQFLYIGKPFYLEGIGTLQFAKTGNFEFIPGEYVTTKLEDPALERADERRRTIEEEERLSPPPPGRQTGRAVLTWLIILVCLGLVAWGGYYFYTLNAGAKASGTVNSGNNSPDVRADTSAVQNPVAAASQPDAGDAASSSAGQSYYDKDTFQKFIVERTTDKQRALNRFRKLKAFGNDIEFETADSITFNLFFILPATTADTLRIRDSLNRWYYGGAKTNRVIVAR